jgi:hypothetical protein
MVGAQPKGATEALAGAVASIAASRGIDWAAGHQISVQISPKLQALDAGGAALGIALALDGLVTGQEADPALAAMGGLAADGAVRPVGSIGRKIREAGGMVQVLIIPEANQSDVIDLLVTDGARPWLAVQVFTAGTLDAARRLVPNPEHRDALLNESMRLFDQVKATLGPRPPTSALFQDSIRLRLMKILELEPGHLSARMLLALAERRVPSRLSLVGSLRLLNEAEQVLKIQDSNALFQAAAELNRWRPILDPEIHVVWDALTLRLEAKRRTLAGSASVGGDWKAKAQQAETSYRISLDALRLIPEVQEAQERLAQEP